MQPKPEEGTQSTISKHDLERPSYRVEMPGRRSTWEHWPMDLPGF